MSAKSNPLVGLLVTMIGIGFAIWGVLVVIEAHSAANWPTVEGTIINSSLEHRVNTTSSGKGKWYYEARIKYGYSVDGVVYESKGSTSSRQATSTKVKSYRLRKSGDIRPAKQLQCIITRKIRRKPSWKSKLPS